MNQLKPSIKTNQQQLPMSIHQSQIVSEKPP